jgi:hypothetical protein
MAVDPSHFNLNTVKKWNDSTLIIPLSGMRHQMHSISVTPITFTKEEDFVQTGIHE